MTRWHEQDAVSRVPRRDRQATKVDGQTSRVVTSQTVYDVTNLHVHHVGAGVDHPQGAVDLKGRRKRAPLVALRQHELEDVAALCGVG